MESFHDHLLVWITLINEAYIELTKNFLESMKRSNCIFVLIVYYVDKSVKEELKSYDNCLCLDAQPFLKSSLISGPCKWMDYEYKKICFAKLDAILYTRQLLRTMNVKYVGYIDTDIVLFYDPTPIALHYIEKSINGIVAQCDEKGFECTSTNSCKNLCAGVIVFPTDKSFDFLFAYKTSDIIECSSDQEFLNNSFKKYKIPFMTIPKHIWMNGAFSNAWNLPVEKDSCLLHFNYMVGNNAKIMKMKQMNLWYL